MRVIESKILPSLSEEIKKNINSGIFSFFCKKSDEKTEYYILMTDKGVMYDVDSTGMIISEIKEMLDNLDTVLFGDIDTISSEEINFYKCAY